MVDPKFFRKHIAGIVSQEYRIDFLGDDFDAAVRRLTETQAERSTSG